MSCSPREVDAWPYFTDCRALSKDMVAIFFSETAPRTFVVGGHFFALLIEKSLEGSSFYTWKSLWSTSAKGICKIFWAMSG
ncbi:hypothetical protein PVK06_009363 [Gossypium arboreum]|uniref:Uncharacterized protein n=1 Tax=Gossypium arboreum TaxID=29729 RepID=A0ABR0QM95_GOSAR|nr:hypothetical protein PVK06_009363 [Gossypium arboreum]